MEEDTERRMDELTKAYRREIVLRSQVTEIFGPDR
jgi:hypothetical protein